MKSIGLLAIVVCCGVATACAGILSALCSIEPQDLRCEYLSNPQGLDVQSPRLYWKLALPNDEKRGVFQKAYHIQVASSKKLLESGKADLWNTGIINSSKSTHIEYEGEPLHYPMNCWWRVRVMDSAGIWSSWSEPAFWTVGPMDQRDWRAVWVGSDEVFVPKSDSATNPNMSNPWIRKTYTLDVVPKSALMYVASVGYHELYINGQKVGDEVLVPSVSDLRTRVRYKTYDIAPYLQKGANAVVLWLGVGWSAYEHYQTPDKKRTPIVLAQADLVVGKETVNWQTDASWKVHSSPSYLLGEWKPGAYVGEYYDATEELTNWNMPELDDSDWENVAVYEPHLKVSADKVEGNRLSTILKPVSIEQLEDNVVKIDMGRNYAGWLKMDLQGNPGDKIDMRWSERPDKDNTFGFHSTYIIGESGKGTFENKFNYSSGRWLYIYGLNYLPSAENIVGYLVTTGYERSTKFECDNSLLNLIYATSLWTFENLSLGGYVVDCPQRERMGYGGDANATMGLALDNYRMGAFYTKWMEDWLDVQREDGSVPYTAPTCWGGGGPAWSGYIVCLPWELYLQYGDKRILDISYPAMQKWLAFLDKNAEDNLLVPWGTGYECLGDWLWPGAQGLETGDPKTLCFNDCYWAYNLQTVANVADVLGLTADADLYREKANDVRKAIQTKYFNAEDNTYGDGSQTVMGMALLANVPPGSLKKAVWDSLYDQIMAASEGHINAGITGGAMLFKLLNSNGRNDLIYPMVSAQDYPGWGDMILNKDATTFLESWEGLDNRDNSMLHSSYLYVGSWFVEGLAGIRSFRTPAEGGFSHFIVEPGYLLDSDIKKVNCTYDSIYGNIVCNWELRGKKLFAKVVVPVGTTAEMRFPVTLDKVYDWATPIKDAAGVTVTDVRSKSVELSAGYYFFEIWLKK